LIDTWSVLVGGGTLTSPVKEAAQFPQKRVLSGFSNSHSGHFIVYLPLLDTEKRIPAKDKRVNVLNVPRFLVPQFLDFFCAPEVLNVF
jgi:hypothetical protein